MQSVNEHLAFQHKMMIAKCDDIIKGMANDIKMLDQIIDELLVLQKESGRTEGDRPPGKRQ
jgi:hypothetical protein